MRKKEARGDEERSVAHFSDETRKALCSHCEQLLHHTNVQLPHNYRRSLYLERQARVARGVNAQKKHVTLTSRFSGLTKI